MTAPTTSIAPDAHWDDRLGTVRGWAELDRESGEAPRPRLLGYLDDRLAVVIDLRPFPGGAIDRPFTEAMAALLGLGCTGIVAAFPGRAWSDRDPIAPVADGVDLRQRVLVVSCARRGDDPEAAVFPFDVEGDGITWLDRLPVAPTDDRVGPMLAVTVAHDHDLPTEEIEAQLSRCVMLGHSVVMADAARR